MLARAGNIDRIRIDPEVLLFGFLPVLVFASGLSQVFNHGTHHRGQITAGLTAAGLTFPSMDMQTMGPAFVDYSHSAAGRGS